MRVLVFEELVLVIDFRKFDLKFGDLSLLLGLLHSESSDIVLGAYLLLSQLLIF